MECRPDDGRARSRAGRGLSTSSANIGATRGHGAEASSALQPRSGQGKPADGVRQLRPCVDEGRWNAGPDHDEMALGQGQRSGHRPVEASPRPEARAQPGGAIHTLAECVSGQPIVPPTSSRGDPSTAARPAPENETSCGRWIQTRPSVDRHTTAEHSRHRWRTPRHR